MAADPDALTGTYYLGHFEGLLAQVQGRYGDLFTAGEQQLLAGFAALPEDGRALYVRFLGRSGQCFREDKLRYPELDLGLALTSLAGAGFIKEATPSHQHLALLTKADLARFFALNERLARPDLLAAAQALPMPPLLFRLWQSEHEGFFRRCLLLYFGNAYQDLSEFVTTTLAHVRYETYSLDPKIRFYRDRAHLERHYHLSELAKTLDKSEDHELLSLGAQWPEGKDLRWQRLTLALARRLERMGESAQALGWYQRLTLPPARERAVRLLANTEGDHAAWLALQPLLAQPQDASEQDFIEGFGQRLARKLGQPWPLAPLGSIAERTLALPQGQDSVEQKALGYFEAGMHSENQLLTGLFGLLFWDIIFAPVPGAFFHPFQRGPADLFGPDFVARRQEAIAARLAEVAQGWLPRAQATLAAKKGLANYLVHWPFWTQAHLALASHIPGEQLAAWFGFLLKDLRHHRSGFPDLLVLDGGQYKLVEVKGPGDRLQPGQKRWLRALSRLSCPAEVLHLKRH
ncbi:VRR-NUC domain-containing protein [Gallaecimonas xiamenensis]|uniref:phosphodiesterase I n=1 Tax=Gallaecimonas xiamenensis 3-C-1 TaxID=745411 RepID=K2K2K5_9GAMM|nr:VRR-NUC domain-containing protein [Gallaecimonas xiamenensis]EKE71695.1 hypothetical protein B3C1_12189 [Gallaecimonas xiamenensis 3-C-1]